MDIKNLLPIGYIVLLNGGEKKLMVCGIKQTNENGEGEEYDYLGVLYPEGNIGESFQYLFNHEDIKEIIFRGYDDDERKDFLLKLRLFMKNDILKSICLAHVGKRDKYEDNFLIAGQQIDSNALNMLVQNKIFSLSSRINSKVSFFAISDGMGGHNGGDVASCICVEKLAEIEKIAKTLLSLKDIVKLVQSSIDSINKNICNIGHTHIELNGMGTTLVLFITYGSEYTILNIGDSRAYYFYGNTLTQLTKDHTEGQRLLDLGLLSRKEIMRFPARKHLNRYIGYDKQGFILQADEYYPTLHGGIILLCSDGITDTLTNEQISKIFLSEKDINIIGKMLIEQAVAHPNADNATAILVKIGGE